jgi:hypothetical protein
MNEPEFYANATLGFRRWHFSPGVERGGPLLLQGMMKYDFKRPHYLWDLKGPNHAECLHLKFNPDSVSEQHGAAPGVGCSCGFYVYGRRDGSGDTTTTHMIEGVVAGWRSLELHEIGFKCGVAKILALFAPDPRKRCAYHDGMAQKKWSALKSMCADNDIPLLPSDSLENDEEVRRYAWERDLMLLQDQLSFSGLPLADTGS